MSGRRTPKTELPPIREIAEALRNGYDFNELCAQYGGPPGWLASRLSYAGYSVDGQPRKTEAPQGVLAGAEGNCITGNGGGDYLGLPIDPVLHRRNRREFVGLDWSTSPATGPQWRYV